MPTPATDAVLILFTALDETEQQEIADRIATALAMRAVSQESASAPFVRSMARIVEFIGHLPSVDEYRDARDALVQAGEDIETYSRLVRHYGTFRRAKEALDLSKTTSIRNADARFRHRRINKIWRFTDETLGEHLARCVEYFGGAIPTLDEHAAWRQRELRLAAAEGNDALQVPSARPYQERWGWAGSFEHFGHSPEAIAQRLERP
jgi:hypothetical protein